MATVNELEFPNVERIRVADDAVGVAYDNFAAFFKGCRVVIEDNGTTLKVLSRDYEDEEEVLTEESTEELEGDAGEGD